MGVMQHLVDKGNSILVIEHDLDVIRCADLIIDLGPDGGDKGGEIVAIGTPETVAQSGDKSPLSRRSLRIKRAPFQTMTKGLEAAKRRHFKPISVIVKTIIIRLIR